MTTIRVKTTYLGATDTLGSRIRVTYPGYRSEFPYPYWSLSPHIEIVMRAFESSVKVTHVKSHARGEWFDVTLN